MEKNKDLEISLLDAPVGAVVDLVSWGSLSQEDIRKLTEAQWKYETESGISE